MKLEKSEGYDDFDGFGDGDIWLRDLNEGDQVLFTSGNITRILTIDRLTDESIFCGYYRFNRDTGEIIPKIRGQLSYISVLTDERKKEFEMRLYRQKLRSVDWNLIPDDTIMKIICVLNPK